MLTSLGPQKLKRPCNFIIVYLTSGRNRGLGHKYSLVKYVELMQERERAKHLKKIKLRYQLYLEISVKSIDYYTIALCHLFCLFTKLGEFGKRGYLFSRLKHTTKL